MELVLAQGVADGARNTLYAFFNFLPRLAAALLIFIAGYVVARALSAAVERLLERVGLDRALRSSPAGRHVERLSPGASAARVIGSIVFWFVLLFAISTAISSLGIPAFSGFLATIYGYLPKVVAALLIFVLAGAIATAIGTLVGRTMGDTPTGRIAQTVVPVLVMGIASFMILDQLEIAPEIVTITYGALIGALALGMALAFGLGGRDLAARMLEDAYRKGQEQRDQVREDLRTGRERTEREARERDEESARILDEPEPADARPDAAGAPPPPAPHSDPTRRL